jgi:hypothetical protein
MNHRGFLWVTFTAAALVGAWYLAKPPRDYWRRRIESMPPDHPVRVLDEIFMEEEAILLGLPWPITVRGAV